MAITYNPVFQHTDYRDNIDRVAAGGPNGINIRFNTIEAEFQQLSQVVHDFDVALSSLGQEVRAPVTVGITPFLFPYGTNPQWSDIQWTRSSGGTPLGTFVEKVTAADRAIGVAPLELPNGVRLIDIKVLGEQTGAGDVVTELFEESRTTPFTRNSLIAVNGLADATTQPTPIPGDVLFQGATNVYYILVGVTGAVGSTIRLRGFQITYQG